MFFVSVGNTCPALQFLGQSKTTSQFESFALTVRWKQKFTWSFKSLTCARFFHSCGPIEKEIKVKSNFKLSRVAASVAVAITGLAVSQVALAGPGWVTAVGPQGTASSEFRKPTFFAYSPSGMRLAVPPEAATLPNANDVTTTDGNGVTTTTRDSNNTGKALRKFVDPLPLPRFAGTPGAAPTLSGDTAAEKYIPVAVSSKWRNPQGVNTDHDYFEIAVVEYSEKFHSDLQPTRALDPQGKLPNKFILTHSLLKVNDTVTTTYCTRKE